MGLIYAHSSSALAMVLNGLCSIIARRALATTTASAFRLLGRCMERWLGGLVLEIVCAQMRLELYLYPGITFVILLGAVMLR